jgi:hypothetical protein
MATPDVQYHNVQVMAQMTAEMLNQYRASKEALGDVFMFKITKLTAAQTFAVNRIMMINVSPTGSLTFTSKELMLKTLNAYMLDPISIMEGPPGYHFLLQQLNPQYELHEMVDITLFGMVIEIISGQAKYPSRFERAHAVLMHLGDKTALDTEFLDEFHILSILLLIGFVVIPPESGQPPLRTHSEATIDLKQIPNDTFE